MDREVQGEKTPPGCKTSCPTTSQGWGGEVGQDEGRGPERGSEGRSWKGAWPTETQVRGFQQSTFQIQACPAISQSWRPMRLQRLFVLRPGTDNGSFITQGTLKQDLTKQWQSQ